MKMKFLAAALLAAGSMSAQAATQTVMSITITGGDFAMGPKEASQTACGQGGPFGNWQCLTAGSVSPIDTDDGLFEGPTLTAFNFFGAPVTTFTAATATGAANSNSGNPIMGSVRGEKII